MPQWTCPDRVRDPGAGLGEDEGNLCHHCRVVPFRMQNIDSGAVLTASGPSIRPSLSGDQAYLVAAVGLHSGDRLPASVEAEGLGGVTGCLGGLTDDRLARRPMLGDAMPNCARVIDPPHSRGS